MEQTFNVIEIKFSGDFLGDSYEYVSQIITDNNGNITIIKSEDIFKAMKFNDWSVHDEHEKKLRKKLLEFVKSYYPKKNYMISYHNVKINY